jgi:hypothetical protein
MFVVDSGKGWGWGGSDVHPDDDWKHVPRHCSYVRGGTRQDRGKTTGRGVLAEGEEATYILTTTGNMSTTTALLEMRVPTEIATK